MYKIKLTPYAKTFYYEWMLNPSSSNYNMVADQVLHGDLDLQRLRLAINKFIAEHLLFNSHIESIDEELFWIKNDYIDELEYKKDKRSNQSLLEYVSRAFDLENGPLYRFLIFKQSPDQHRFIAVCHHILVDGLSTDDGIFENITNYYNNDVYTAKYDIPTQIALNEQISDSLSNLVDNNIKNWKSFWQENLTDINAVDLKFLKSGKKTKPIGTIKKHYVDEVRFIFNNGELEELHTISRRYITTPFIFGQIIFAYLLSCHTTQNEFGICFPVAIPEGIDFIYGAQVNTIIMPYKFNKNDTILDLFKRIHGFIKSLKPNKQNYNSDNKFCPIADIINISNAELLNVGFIQANLKDINYKFNSITTEIISKFNIDLAHTLLFEQEVKNGDINYRVRYSNLDIDEDLLLSFVNKYKKLFKAILADLFSGVIDKPLKEYNILDAVEYKKIVHQFSVNETFNNHFYSTKLTHHLFEEQVVKTPNNIAITCNDVKLTYNELNCQANKLAHYLISYYHIKPDELVVLFLNRNELILIAILAVLKSGGSYVPIDQSYPEERVKYIVCDTQPHVILTNELYRDKLQKILSLCPPATAKSTFDSHTVLAIDSHNIKTILLKSKKTNPLTSTKSSNLAYVIYTSGTTGRPKGVMIEHRNLVGFITNFLNFPPNKPQKPHFDTLSTTNYIFDIFNLEYMLPLFNGSCLYLIDILNQKDKLNLKNFDYIQITPSKVELLISLVEYDYPNIQKKHKVTVLVGGEIVTQSTLAAFYNLKSKLLNNIEFEIINMYGPTETTIWSTARRINDDIDYKISIIGKPLINESAYVLDKNLSPVPIGAIGELYIGGIGLARGYLNNPELTQERFIPNPFQTSTEKMYEENQRLYQTGDLVRWLPDGNLEYIGRNDYQIKIRGYRIEPGEIEACINSYPGIKQSVVIARDNLNTNTSPGDKCLVGYYVSPEKLNQEAIISHLRSQLPDRMVPLLLVHLHALPLTINGKLDKAALPIVKFDHNNNYISPRNYLEQQLCRVFAQILGLSENQIGIKDDFFSLGGSSILAIKLKNKLKNDLGLNIDIGTIFKQRNIYSIIDGLNNKNNVTINKYTGLKESEYKLSFAQERLWFIDRFVESKNTYNVTFVSQLSQKCNITALLASINDIITRHEILRTIIREDKLGNIYQQVLQPNFELIEQYVNNRSELHDAIVKEVNYVFNLKREIPFRACHYIFNKDHYLSIVIHHIACDGWSADILMRDLLIFYKHNLKLNPRKNQSVKLPPLDIQYRDFALWQREYFQNKFLDEQLAYWKDKLTDYETLNLPIDKIRPTTFDYKGDVFSFKLGMGLSRRLRATARELNVSLFSLLLSGFYLLLHTYSNQDDIIVGTPVSNRHYLQIENLVGFFVNTLVLRNKSDVKITIVDYIRQVFNEVIEAQIHQDLPFERLVQELALAKDTSRHPLFQVMFQVQHFGVEKQELFTPYNFDGISQTAKFDLTLWIDDAKERLRGIFEYATSLFTDSTINGYFSTYVIILEQLAKVTTKEYIHKTLKDIKYIDPISYKNLLKSYQTSTRKIDSENKTIHQFFETQVIKNPKDIAVVCGNVKLTYNELNFRANKLAHYLIDNYQIKPDELIAIYLDKSEYVLIAILAILKSGGAYVPINAAYPNERTKYILWDTRPQIILTNEIYQYKLQDILNFNSTSRTSKQNFINCDILAIDSKRVNLTIAKQSRHNIKNKPLLMNLAYVIYTSGTTGKPKGVMITHNSLVNYYNNVKERIFTDSHMVMDYSTNISFDLTVTSTICALCNGYTINVYEGSLQDIDSYKNHLIKNDINIVKMVPSYFELIIDTIPNTNIRTVILGGEKVSSSILEKIEKLDIEIYDEYGPTETTVGACLAKINVGINQFGSPNNIGKPYNNYSAYVLDKNLSLIPTGAIGELYIGGVGLSRGYWNNPELTLEKFIPNPFQASSKDTSSVNQKIYQTGDLVRWLPNGNLEYIGRNDCQIKIRGYRIEPEEIEKCINNYPGIKQSVVISSDNINGDWLAKDKYLIGYYVKDLDIKDSDNENYIKNWRNLYDSTYSELSYDNFKEDIIGWTSSYTGKIIDKKDMLEWRDETVKRIKNLNPNVILEIGSGSGLLLFSLINSCQYYYATDFSAIAVSYTEKLINHLSHHNKAKAIRCDAGSLPYKTFSKKYDTVILNSVIQYFPSLEYFEIVLSKLIDNMCSSGQIFIGDIRDFRLLDCFYFSILKFKTEKVSADEIEHHFRREKELLITPAYFLNLKDKNLFITNVELLPKLGNATNEMNCYRYDVVLHINKTENPKYEIVDIKDFESTIDIKTCLLKQDKKLYIKYPNKRIWADYIQCTKLYKKDDRGLGLSIKSQQILTLKELQQLCLENGYVAKFYLDAIDPLYINIVALKTNKLKIKNILIKYVDLPSTPFSNNPLQNLKLLESQHTDELRSYLESMLPDYMVPNHLVLLDKIPLSINGKLDNRRLPNPIIANTDDYYPPRNELENQLCKIFSQVLGVSISAIGIKNDFFLLGGNSILAIKLVSIINSTFKCQLKISHVFAIKTVEKLAVIVSETKNVFNLVSHLNNSTDKLNLFMLHPGFAGAEVYVSLAQKLSMYSCYGLDNYNLHHKNKISNLHQLADSYLLALDEIREKTNQIDKPYILLGWSLGGQIAIEIASILEQKGYTNITVILLDSVLADTKFASYLSKMKINAKLLSKFLLSQGHLIQYINKVIANFDCDNKLSKQSTKNKLDHTKILLFKAMQPDTRKFLNMYDVLNKYTIGLAYNNIEKIANFSNIQLIRMDNANHSNIIENTDLICTWISQLLEA